MTAVELDESTPAVIQPAVRLRSVSKSYGNLVAVNAVDLEIPTGSIFGLIGPNGAGKSTTMAMIATLLTQTSGTVEVLGIEPRSHPGEVRRRLGYMPDVLGVYDDMTVEEYLSFFAGAYRLRPSTHADTVGRLLELVDLSTKRSSQVNSLSRGMKQRLSLARALVNDPDGQLQEMGKTIVISSHILAELAEMCSEVAVLELGRLLASGPLDQIRAQLGGTQEVEARYADGSVERFEVEGPEHQHELLLRLTADPRRLVEFREMGTGLEDVFLRLTRGEVQ